MELSAPMNDAPVTIIDHLRAEKRRRGWSNQRIADESGVPVGTINRIFAERTANPTYLTVVPLCRVLGVSVDEVEGITETRDNDANAAPRTHEDREPRPFRARSMSILDRVRCRMNSHVLRRVAT